ncbi:unnamed protein product [Taenia asiatica]|uniref:DUF775 domain-containing protein n=1 Tax=Taenia asiatica TaxID=60517 RepID=A0A0R3WCV1_TAEAS|nr:unnamed protein product [Taenia asiatica]
MFAALLTGQIVVSFSISNHVVVFLTGQVPLPEGYGAGGKLSQIIAHIISSLWYTSWSYLGYLSNDRPSAIFRVSGLKSSNISNLSIGNTVTAQVGISIEHLAELAGQTSAIENSNSAGVDDNMRFTQFAAENLYHFAAGCAQEVPGTSEAYVPISAVKRWYDTIRRKLSLDPNFWKK